MKNLKFVFFALALFSASLVQAQTAPIDDNGVAIGGYDVVSYFSEGAVKGVESYAVKHNDATYFFSTKANMEAFQESPAQYLPQYDGYCAWGVAAQESKFPINPETFDIIDGKLYLFFNGPFKGDTFNSLNPWNAETTKLIEAADENWGKVK